MKLRPFELALVIIFIGLAGLALLLLSTYRPAPDNPSGLAQVGTVSIWGIVPADGINAVLADLSETDKSYDNVSYRYIAPDQFDATLLNALADGRGPDVVLISHEQLVDMRRRIQPVSYTSFPLRDIRTSYVDGAQIFALSDGLYGLPIAVDPLMMYWNRDMLATKGYLDAPRTWENLINTMFPELIVRDFNRTITRSVVAMGEYGNVRNAFGVLSALIIQGGSQRVTEAEGEYTIRLQSSVAGGTDPLRAAADFYTRFSKPANTLYSWNRAFPEDRTQFTAEDLVFYFGYASEGEQIERINPNLNFDIAEIPQGANATVRRTYGKFYGLSLLNSSDNKSGALAVMYNLAGAAIADRLATESGMTPAFRNSLAAGSNDTYGRVAYQSASIALGWLNPDPAESDQIFATMTSDINENRQDVSGAVSDVVGRLDDAY